MLQLPKFLKSSLAPVKGLIYAYEEKGPFKLTDDSIKAIDEILKDDLFTGNLDDINNEIVMFDWQFVRLE